MDFQKDKKSKWEINNKNKKWSLDFKINISQSFEEETKKSLALCDINFDLTFIHQKKKKISLLYLI